MRISARTAVRAPRRLTLTTSLTLALAAVILVVVPLNVNALGESPALTDVRSKTESIAGAFFSGKLAESSFTVPDGCKRFTSAGVISADVISADVIIVSCAFRIPVRPGPDLEGLRATEQAIDQMAKDKGKQGSVHWLTKHRSGRNGVYAGLQDFDDPDNPEADWTLILSDGNANLRMIGEIVYSLDDPAKDVSQKSVPEEKVVPEDVSQKSVPEEKMVPEEKVVPEEVKGPRRAVPERLQNLNLPSSDPSSSKKSKTPKNPKKNSKSKK